MRRVCSLQVSWRACLRLPDSPPCRKPVPLVEGGFSPRRIALSRAGQPSDRQRRGRGQTVEQARDPAHAPGLLLSTETGRLPGVGGAARCCPVAQPNPAGLTAPLERSWRPASRCCIPHQERRERYPEPRHGSISRHRAPGVQAGARTWGDCARERLRARLTPCRRDTANVRPLLAVVKRSPEALLVDPAPPVLWVSCSRRSACGRPERPIRAASRSRVTRSTRLAGSIDLAGTHSATLPSGGRHLADVLARRSGPVVWGHEQADRTACGAKAGSWFDRLTGEADSSACQPAFDLDSNALCRSAVCESAAD